MKIYIVSIDKEKSHHNLLMIEPGHNFLNLQKRVDIAVTLYFT